MKIALHIPFGGRFVAERELAPRMVRAFRTLGHEASLVFTADEIDRLTPDFVLAMNHRVAKLTPYPTYGCMWNPPTYLATERMRIDVCSYDGYFHAAPSVARWVDDALRLQDKGESMGLLLPSANRGSFEPGERLTSGDVAIAYFGANWAGPRHGALFERLDGEGFMQCYGDPEGWAYLKRSYAGEVSFDGQTVIDTIRGAGAGLCLHSPEHTAAAMPSMRIFEIAAAGAVAICGRHPFVEEAFGDSVLYVDASPDVEQQALSIRRHWQWIRDDPGAAIALAEKAHAISLSYSLERQLQAMVDAHAARMDRLRQRSRRLATAQPPVGRVQVVVRTGGRDVRYLRRALASIEVQTYPSVEVILVVYGNRMAVAAVIDEWPALKFTIVESDDTGFRSTQLFDGLRAVTAEFFSILDDDDVYYPEHLADLVSLLRANGRVDLAYSGSNYLPERVEPQPPTKEEQARIGLYGEFSRAAIEALDSPIGSNSFVARSSVLGRMPLRDPSLVVAEVDYLLLQALRFSDASFSWNVTCGFYRREDTRDNACFLDSQVRADAVARIRFLAGLPAPPPPITPPPDNHAARLDAILQSSSWRITAPYRTVGRLLRRLAARWRRPTS